MGRGSPPVWLGPSNIAPPTELEIDKIAASFQSKFLMFRLKNLGTVASSEPSHLPASLANSDLAHNLLLARGWEEPATVEMATPLLLAQEEYLRQQVSFDANVILLECLWVPAHKNEDMRLADLQLRINALMRSRGEPLAFNVKEIGWKLAHFGIPRKRDSKGMRILFSSAIRERIHRLVQQYGLNLPQQDQCADCRDSSLERKVM